MSTVRTAGHAAMQSGQSEEVLQGHLYSTMQQILANQNRVQPIIGLSAMTECYCSVYPPMYVCEVCSLLLTKAEIKNHITGSQHRFCYIKSRHAYDWQADADLTLLVWPLKEVARVLESREGTGKVQVLELDEETYRNMTSDPASAVTLLQATRRQQKKVKVADAPPTSVIPDHASSEGSPGDGLLVPDRRSSSESDDTMSSSVHLPGPSAAGPDPATLSVKAELPGTFSQLEERLQEPFVKYDGPKPLIGLQAVVQCVGDVGAPPPCCYLCQSCSKRVTDDHIIDHLTSAFHQYHYIKSQHSHLLRKMKVGMNGISVALRALSVVLEREKGRGQMQVKRTSTSLLCEVLQRPFQWGDGICPKLSVTLAPCAIGGHEAAAKHGPAVSEAANAGKPTPSQPMFKVTLPLREGPVLVQRAEFGRRAAKRKRRSAHRDWFSRVEVCTDTMFDGWRNTHPRPPKKKKKPKRKAPVKAGQAKTSYH
ncbi:uncharacterized protein LOC114796570 isoform X5 [Denticeps clupeoides]|uniref:uncharacterized protein LOC114796570 isoform X5 n=1 Tax=Denticeps clupeoides TaxID=299321 RepID=UPI0010A3C08D|nr:uncharacterized protein LOC114796570 isoform X5 [Denticeps clupeoides]